MHYKFSSSIRLSHNILDMDTNLHFYQIYGPFISRFRFIKPNSNSFVWEPRSSKKKSSFLINRKVMVFFSFLYENTLQYSLEMPWQGTSDEYYNIGITHGFSCINICRVPRKLFEHEVARPSVQISSEGLGKCYCNEITMADRCSCTTYNSNGKMWQKRPRASYKLYVNLFKCTGKPTWLLVQNVIYNDTSCAMTLWCHHKILKCYVQGDNVTSLKKSAWESSNFFLFCFWPCIKMDSGINISERLCLVGLEFNGPLHTIKVMLSQSVNLLSQVSPLSS